MSRFARYFGVVVTCILVSWLRAAEKRPLVLEYIVGGEVEKGTKGVPCEIKGYTMSTLPGGRGRIVADERYLSFRFKVVQVLDGNSMLIRGAGKTWWTNCNTSGVVDDSYVSFRGSIFTYAGTKQYNTATGSTNTVHVLNYVRAVSEKPKVKKSEIAGFDEAKLRSIMAEYETEVSYALKRSFKRDLNTILDRNFPEKHQVIWRSPFVSSRTVAKRKKKSQLMVKCIAYVLDAKGTFHKLVLQSKEKEECGVELAEIAKRTCKPDGDVSESEELKLWALRDFVKDIAVAP